MFVQALGFVFYLLFNWGTNVCFVLTKYLLKQCHKKWDYYCHYQKILLVLPNICNYLITHSSIFAYLFRSLPLSTFSHSPHPNFLFFFLTQNNSTVIAVTITVVILCNHNHHHRPFLFQIYFQIWSELDLFPDCAGNPTQDRDCIMPHREWH